MSNVTHNLDLCIILHLLCVLYLRVDMPNLVAYLNWTPILEWYVVKPGFVNKYQKDMCLKEIGLRSVYMTNIKGSIINVIGGGAI